MTEVASLTKNMLIVNQTAPYASSNAQEAIDLALAAAAFDQEVRVLFTGDACYLLMDKQNPNDIDRKQIQKMLKAFPIYNIEKLYVDRASFEARNLSGVEAGLNMEFLDQEEVSQLYRTADAVIQF